MHGAFVWNELATTDVERAKRFYSELLGWSFESFDLPEGAYWVVRKDGELVAGLGALETGSLPDQQRSYWFSFLEIDDIDARFEQALQLGATAIQRPMDVPAVGRVAVLRDPTGAAIGWLTGLDGR